MAYKNSTGALNIECHSTSQLAKEGFVRRNDLIDEFVNDIRIEYPMLDADEVGLSVELYLASLEELFYNKVLHEVLVYCGEREAIQ